MKFAPAQPGLWPNLKTEERNVAGGPHLLIRTCAHILESGRLCQRPAVAGRRHCRHHIVLQVRRHRMARARRRLGRLRLPSLMDLEGVQAGLARVRSALAAGYIEPDRASVLASVLRLVASLERQVQADYEAAADPQDRAVRVKSNGNYEVAGKPDRSRRYVINGP